MFIPNAAMNPSVQISAIVTVIIGKRTPTQERNSNTRNKMIIPTTGRIKRILSETMYSTYRVRITGNPA